MGVDYYINTVLKVYLYRNKNIKIQELKKDINYFSSNRFYYDEDYEGKNLQKYFVEVEKYIFDVNEQMEKMKETLEKMKKINEENEDENYEEICVEFLVERDGNYYSEYYFDREDIYKQLKPDEIIYENGNFIKGENKREDIEYIDYMSIILGKTKNDYDWYGDGDTFENINKEDIKKIVKCQNIEKR